MNTFKIIIITGSILCLSACGFSFGAGNVNPAAQDILVSTLTMATCAQLAGQLNNCECETFQKTIQACEVGLVMGGNCTANPDCSKSSFKKAD